MPRKHPLTQPIPVLDGVRTPSNLHRGSSYTHLGHLPQLLEGVWTHGCTFRWSANTLYTMLYRSSAFVARFRTAFSVSFVFGAQFVTTTSTCLMTFFFGFITARELTLITNVFRFLVATRGAQLAGSVIKPLHNQPLHGSGPRSFFVFTQIVSPAP